MTQEEKELLLKDLCARLPYGVICKVKYILNNETTYGEDIEKECTDVVKRINFDRYTVYTEWLRDESDIEDIKPYLRPISSMTAEEKEDFGVPFTSEGLVTLADTVECMDWLNAHHFDYCSLIEKGLALEAPKDMYNEK